MNLPTPPVRAASGRLLRKTAVELVADELRARIMSGALAPGTALRQEALSTELGVSRIPLREAIRLLSSEGLVDLVPHKGAYVSIISQAEVKELFELRLHLEPWLLHEAVPLITEAELALATQMTENMRTIEAQSWGKLNWELHEQLYRAAGRPAALSIVRSLHEKTERYLHFQVVNTPARQQAHVEHLHLIELCRQRKADQAMQAMSKHISDASEQILAIVARFFASEAEPASR